MDEVSDTAKKAPTAAVALEYTFYETTKLMTEMHSRALQVDVFIPRRRVHTRARARACFNKLYIII